MHIYVNSEHLDDVALPLSGSATTLMEAPLGTVTVGRLLPIPLRASVARSSVNRLPVNMEFLARHPLGSRQHLGGAATGANPGYAESERRHLWHCVTALAMRG